MVLKLLVQPLDDPADRLKLTVILCPE